MKRVNEIPLDVPPTGHHVSDGSLPPTGLIFGTAESFSFVFDVDGSESDDITTDVEKMLRSIEALSLKRIDDSDESQG